MSRILNICMGLALASSLMAQPASDTLNRKDQNGMKQGHWIGRFENGKVRYDGYFKNDKPVGIMKRYYDDGSIKVIFDYQPAGNQAYAKMYYQNGVLAGEGKFVNNKKDSLWKYYSYYEKYKVAEETYVAGLRHGVCRIFYSNGQVSEEMEWENGQKSGPWKQFFDNGKLQMEGSHLAGKRTGPFFYYFPSGNYESKGFFKGDQMDGTWVYMNLDGSVKLKVEYVNGLPKDPSILEQKEKEFFKMVESNRGKITEPTEADVVPMR